MRYSEILEACWTGYRQAGMKKKGNRQVPNCVPKQGVKEDKLNELDIFAPVTTYVRLANGTYVAASWRRNQNLSTASNSASFIDIKPVAPNVAKQLGLDQRLNDPEKKYTGAATIASGGPIQSSGPLADRTINVVDIRDPKAAKDNGVPNSIFGKIAQWSQQQDQTKQGVAEAKSASRRWHDALQREKERRERNERAGQELLNPKKKEEPKEKDMSEGDSGAKYKVRSIGHDAKGDYYISPSTGKKVYKKGVKVGDHENPKTGEHKSVAEGDVNEGWDDIKKFGKKAAVAGAIGLGALGSAQAQDAPSGEDMLPSIVAHVTFKVDGKTISKDINLGTTFKSPGQAGDALAKFLKSKGIKYYDYSLERVKANEPLVTPDEMRASNQEYDRRQNANNLDTSPLTDKGDSKAGRMEPDRGYTSPSRGAQTKDYMSKEGMAEGDSPAMAHTAKSLENPPKVMRHRAKRDQERDKQLQYRNIAKRDEDLDEKIKGADGKACWPGFRYNGTENGSDKCVKIGEAWELEMSNAISKLFENR